MSKASFVSDQYFLPIHVLAQPSFQQPSKSLCPFPSFLYFWTLPIGIAKSPHCVVSLDRPRRTWADQIVNKLTHTNSWHLNSEF